MPRELPDGITLRHARSCPSRQVKFRAPDCRCDPSYKAQVWSVRDRRRLTRSFARLSEARTWREDAAVAVRAGKLKPGGSQTFRQLAEEWLRAAEAGTARNRSGDPFKPSTLRGYRDTLHARLYGELGDYRLADVRRSDLKRLATALLADGLEPSTVRNALMPVRVVYAWAVEHDVVAVNPTAGLKLPASRGRRERVVEPAEATRLLAALPYPDRALWATAIYAGLRAGELMALEWEHVDFKAGVIRVEAGWDRRDGSIDPKSRAGRRVVPLAAAARRELEALRFVNKPDGGLVFAGGRRKAFSRSHPNRRAARLWKNAKLEAITLHDCRHTYASLMIAAGMRNMKALSVYMGHSSVTITWDRYGHLLPGNEDEAAQLLDTYLEQAVEA